jgi:transposase
MPSITKQRLGAYTYIYEAVSYWNPELKRPENNKISIGKIDSVTGETYYKQQYIDKLKRDGKPVDGMQIWSDGRKVSAKNEKHESAADSELAREILETVKCYGVAYFLQSTAEKTGLMECLKEAFPIHWQKIFVLACYLVASDKPIMLCADWLEDNEFIDAGSLASQRVSELLSCFGHKERSDFYSLWCRHISEREYIALDITSVSSYSKQNSFMEWGYNRDGEDLPQVNICMLFGEKSRMPIYQTLYSGSLGDVSTLETTLAEFSALTNTQDPMLVMDKGFFSRKNVNMLLGISAGKKQYKFMIPVSFTSKFAKELVALERTSIDCIENIIFTSSSPIRGVHKLLKWPGASEEIHAHVFFNPDKALKDRNALYANVTRLKIMAQSDPDNKKLQKEYKRYLVITPPVKANDGAFVEIRKDVIEKELENAGWFILISNQIEDTQNAYNLYRAKDVVEKSFFQYKNNLGIDRLHVHGDERMLNKTFLAFVALILSSHAHNIMKEKHLDSIMSFNEMLNALAKLKTAYVKGVRVLRALTKEQKMIFDSFDICYPV